MLFYNKGKGKFQDITERGGPYFQAGHRGRGVAIGDLNNDGLPDLVVSHVNDPMAILRNTCDAANHWLGVSLTSKDRRTFVGSKLVLEHEGRNLTRFVKGGGSYLSSNDPRIIFGLGQANNAGKLTVEWSTGTPRTEHWNNLAVDQYHELVQGSSR